MTTTWQQTQLQLEEDMDKVKLWSRKFQTYAEQQALSLNTMDTMVLEVFQQEIIVWIQWS